MRLTNLADVVRASGLRVVEVPGWESRGRATMQGPRGVVWHHTGTANRFIGDYPSLSVVTRGRIGLTGPLCHLGLGRDGSVYVVAAGKANHAGRGSWPGLGGNTDCIGVEMESPGDGTWTAAQLAAMPLLRDALSRGYSIPLSRHIAHREWAPGRKIDPAGIDIRGMKPAAGSRPGKSTPASWSTLRRGDRGKSVTYLQSLLRDDWASKVAVDGVFGSATEAVVRNFQRVKGLMVDGIVGPATWMALTEKRR